MGRAADTIAAVPPANHYQFACKPGEWPALAHIATHRLHALCRWSVDTMAHWQEPGTDCWWLQTNPAGVKGDAFANESNGLILLCGPIVVAEIFHRNFQ
jgi:hypothetical protein